MSMPVRTAALLPVVAAAALALALVTAAPGTAQTDDSEISVPTLEDSVSNTVDHVWNQFVPPNGPLPQNPVATFGQWVDSFFPIFR